MTEPVTKTIFVNCPASKLYRFLANAENWPRWAVHNILAVRPDGDGWWSMDTPRGPGRLRIRTGERQGIIDHEFIDAQGGRWDVPARVVAAGCGSLVILTLTKPGPMPTDLFEIGMTQLDDELATLKRVVEAGDDETVNPPTQKPRPVGGVKRVKVQSGMNDPFEALFAQLQSRVQDSGPGAVYYDLFRSRTDPQTYFVLEKYDGPASWEAHQHADYGTVYFPQIRAILDDISVEYFDEIGE